MKFFTSVPLYHPNPFPLSLIGSQAPVTQFLPAADLLSGIPIGHWDPHLIINSPLLISIPGIHSLTCLLMIRSLVIYIKHCSILWNFISSYIITLYLFFHYIFVIISNSLSVKIYCFRDYFMLIIVQLTWQWPITASMLYINLDSLPLFR